MNVSAAFPRLAESAAGEESFFPITTRYIVFVLYTETGTPSFLIKLFKKNQYLLPDLENIEVSEQILSSFENDSHDPITLLFQTGYLTIEKTFIREGERIFRLKIPNKEVQLSLGGYFIKDDKDDARK